MIFAILIVYQILLILQPHRWGATPFLENAPITVLLLLLAFMMFVLSSHQKRIVPHNWLMIWFSVVVILSGALNGWLGGGVMNTFNFTLTSTIPFFLYSNLLESARRQKVIMALCVVSALFMVSNGMSQRASETGMGWAGSEIMQGTRIAYIGILNDPNDLGGFLVLSLPFALHFLFCGRPISKLFGMASSVTILYGIYLTNSRGALLATVGMVAIYIFFRYGKGVATFLSILMVPVLGLVFSQFRTIDTSEMSAAGRTEAWYEGFQMFQLNPVWGVGMGNFTEYHGLTAHNSFILVMSELGLLGYSAWFCIITLSFLMGAMMYSKFRAYQKEEGAILHKGDELYDAFMFNNTVLLSFIGYFTTTLFLSRSYNFITFFICALMVAAYSRITNIRPEYRLSNISFEVSRLMAASVASILLMNVGLKILI